MAGFLKVCRVPSLAVSHEGTRFLLPGSFLMFQMFARTPCLPFTILHVATEISPLLSNWFRLLLTARLWFPLLLFTCRIHLHHTHLQSKIKNRRSRKPLDPQALAVHIRGSLASCDPRPNHLLLLPRVIPLVSTVLRTRCSGVAGTG